MRYARSLKSFLCVVAVLVLTGSLGGKPPAPDLKLPVRTSDESSDEQVLEDLLRIRQQVGGSVLRGSVLEDATNDGRESDSEMRKVLGLSSPKANTVEKMTSPQIVKTLREHCSRIDRIANELETLRQYDNADKLRDTATRLRHIARQFDPPAKHKH